MSGDSSEGIRINRAIGVAAGLGLHAPFIEGSDGPERVPDFEPARGLARVDRFVNLWINTRAFVHNSEKVFGVVSREPLNLRR